MSNQRVIVAGGGAAGFFAAIACAQAGSGREVLLFERGPEFLSKVKISGGGRCNVTHAAFDPADLAAHYPRGRRELMGPFQSFQPRDTIEWFETRGVRLVTQPDGCLFPATQSSRTVIELFLREASSAGVRLETGRGIDRLERLPEGGFLVTAGGGAPLRCGQVLLATGGCRGTEGARLPAMLGHEVIAPVPSLFTFNVPVAWLRALAGVVVEDVEASVPGLGLRERGTILLTHWGVSGPVILKLSAWGARLLHERAYDFEVEINWMPGRSEDAVLAALEEARRRHPARLLVNTAFPPLPARLWEQLVLAAEIPRETRWAALSKASARRLAADLSRGRLPVKGKSTHKEEFVTAGGVRLGEVNFKRMESRLCPGLFFAGEMLDIDGLTGGFNFQAAWTTGWIAGRSMAGT